MQKKEFNYTCPPTLFTWNLTGKMVPLNGPPLGFHVNWWQTATNWLGLFPHVDGRLKHLYIPGPWQKVVEIYP